MAGWDGGTDQVLVSGGDVEDGAAAGGEEPPSLVLVNGVLKYLSHKDTS